MQFLQLIREIELYVHMEGDKIREMIKRHINEAILDFLRTKEWDKVKAIATFTLDGSGSYAISTGATPIAADFEGEIGLFNDSGTEFTKLGYPYYLRAENRAEAYSILGDNLYVDGNSGDLTLIYVARGAQYPLTAEDDEVWATLHYWDIIKQMVVVRILKFLGDPSQPVEQQELDRKLVLLRNSENRIRKNGKAKIVQR